jgi:hypothetical protein
MLRQDILESETEQMLALEEEFEADRESTAEWDRKLILPGT